MDFYNYYSQKLECTSSPETSIADATGEAIKLINEAPTPIGLEASVGFLAAIHSYGNPQSVELAPIFERVELAIKSVLYAMRCDLEAADNLWAENLTLGADSYCHMLGSVPQSIEPKAEKVD